MTRQEFRLLFEKTLPGESSHLAFSPIRMKSSEALKSATTYRNAAVAIIVLPKFDFLSSLVIERQSYDGTHSGQISFPGGKVDESDANLMQTAIRECFEEIGVQLTIADFISELTPVFIPVSGFYVRPFVFYLDEIPQEYVKNSREVAEIHQIELVQLLDEKIVFEKDIVINSQTTLSSIKHFKFNEIEIWGATALMLNELKEVLK